MGVPLAAAQLWPRPAYAYHAPALAERRGDRGLGGDLTLGQLLAAAARVAAALREELAIAMRGLFLFCLFLPAVVTAPACLLSDAHRQRWLDLVRWTLEQAGPAFIKWGQWAATRPDLFPQDACAALAALQTEAPTHAYAHTVAAVESSLGARLPELFSSFETEPVASGSIAQVRPPSHVAACPGRPRSRQTALCRLRISVARVRGALRDQLGFAAVAVCSSLLAEKWQERHACSSRAGGSLHRHLAPAGVPSHAHRQGRQAGRQPHARRAAAPAPATALSAGQHCGGQGECSGVVCPSMPGRVAAMLAGHCTVGRQGFCSIPVLLAAPHRLWPVPRCLQVRHPGVGVLMERDFTLMRRAAQLLAALPLVGTPQVKESVMQVGRLPGARRPAQRVEGPQGAGQLPEHK